MNSYYNTTAITDQERQTYERKAKSQEKEIMKWMKVFCAPVSAEDIKTYVTEFKNTPITSVRRALHNLKDLGLIAEAGQKKGDYGRPVTTYQKIKP